MLLGIGHNAVNALNMEKMLGFYTGALGFQRAFEIPRDGMPWIVYLKVGNGGFLELFYGGEKDREDNYGADLIGCHHWSVNCRDLPTLRERIIARGCGSPDMAVREADSGRSIWVHDPEGNALELVQPKAPGQRKTKIREIVHGC